MTPHRIRVEQQGEVLVASVLAESLLDPVVVRELNVELMALVAERPSKLVVNFLGVTRSSTEVINSLLLAKKRLLTHGGDLRLCGLSESMRHTFRILNLEGTVFAVFETEGDAVSGF